MQLQTTTPPVAPVPDGKENPAVTDQKPVDTLQPPQAGAPSQGESWWQQIVRNAPNCKTFSDGCRRCDVSYPLLRPADRLPAQGVHMRRPATLVSIMLSALILAAPGALAQDVRGLEVCTAEKQMDRRTGCLQANIDYLMQLIDKNARDARQKLDAAAKELTAARNEVTALKASLAAMQARLDKLEKPEKPKDAK